MNLQITLKKFIGKIMQDWIPVKQITVRDSRAETPALVQNLSADRVLAIISSAEQGDTRELFALYRDMILTDSHFQAEFSKRKLAVLGDVVSFTPFDRKLKADIDTANIVDQEVGRFKGWIRACAHLLDGTLYPVSVLEKVFRPTPSGFALDELVPVPYQLLDYTTGKLMIHDADPSNGQILPEMHAPDPNSYIVHRGHLLSTPDNWGGPMRSILFWWLLSTMDREWWAKFLERFGTPFLVGKFNDEDGRNTLERAFALASRLGGLVISDGTEVEIKQAAATDTGTAYEKFLSICQREKSKLILGQTLSAEAQPTGLGAGTSNMQEDVRDDIRRFDSRLLSETLRDQLLTQYCAINRLPGKVPLISWGSESETKIKATIALLTSLGQAGLEVSDDDLYVLSERTGLQLQRKTTAPFAPFVTPFSQNFRGRLPSDKMDEVARAAAPDLAQAFSGSLAPVAQIIRRSKSAKECEEMLREFYVEWKPGKLNTLIADALTAYAANGTNVRRN